MVKAREKKEKKKIDRERKRKKEGEKGKERKTEREEKKEKQKKGEKKMFIEPCMRFGYCLQLGTWNTIISPLLEGYQGLHSWQGLLVLK